MKNIKGIGASNGIAFAKILLIKDTKFDVKNINEKSVIVIHDVEPSDIKNLDNEFIKGVVTEIGGKTSHLAVAARALELPVVVGIGNEISNINGNEKIIINGDTGEIIINPDKKEIERYNSDLNIILNNRNDLLKYKDKPSISKDGWETIVAANIGSPKEIKMVTNNGAKGVGLFRSEFLYMESDNWPTEEQQFKAYKKVVESFKDERVIIRMLDIGGDKKLNYFKFPYEMNPFLGYRAIRLQLDKMDIFRTQIRALLRASAFGNLAINVPMIATIDEFKKVKETYAIVEKELKSEGHKIGKYLLGVMIEVPAAVELADKFAKYADFFSVGTNDLIQYSFAADRMSNKVSYLYQPFNPAFLRKIKRIIDCSHNEGKFTAICGDISSEPLLAPILVGMELDEFSMPPSLLLRIRRIISKINRSEAKLLVEHVLDLETQDEVIKAIKKWLAEREIDV